jgi:hypothetical protein
MLRRVALIGTYVLEECIASNILVTRASELGKTLTVIISSDRVAVASYC